MYNLLREKENELILPENIPKWQDLTLKKKSLSPNKVSHEEEKLGRLLKMGDRGWQISRTFWVLANGFYKEMVVRKWANNMTRRIR